MDQHFQRDADEVIANLGCLNQRFEGKRILITGAGGFLGSHLLHLFARLIERRVVGAISVTACDPFLRGRPAWLTEVESCTSIRVVHGDITNMPLTQTWDFVLHAASIASPTYYRKNPVETIDANVIGLRRLLGHVEGTSIEGFLFFSSSEIYGDPPISEVPTQEEFFGHVSSTGPRSCYDESKRLGEALCVAFARSRGVPTRMVRPFNNYGPGLPIDDRRVLADFCRDALAGKNITLLSDGSATRTFCYAADAINGHLRALLLGKDGRAYNIGCDSPEISMRDLANLVIGLAGTGATIEYRVSDDPDYLTDNPHRRCPNIDRASRELQYEPAIGLQEGLLRLLAYYRDGAAQRRTQS